MPVIACVDEVWNNLMVQLSEWRECSNWWTLVLCLGIEKRLQILVKDSLSLEYTKSLNLLYEVHDKYLLIVDSIAVYELAIYGYIWVPLCS